MPAFTEQGRHGLPCQHPPDRAFWPLCPRPEVLPRPEPMPRPTRLGCRQQGGQCSARERAFRQRTGACSVPAAPPAARPPGGATLCWKRPIAATHVVRGPRVVYNVVQGDELALSGLAGGHCGEPSAADELQGLPHGWTTAASGHRLLQRRQAGRGDCCRAAAAAPELCQAAQQRCLSLPQHDGCCAQFGSPRAKQLSGIAALRYTHSTSGRQAFVSWRSGHCTHLATAFIRL